MSTTLKQVKLEFASAKRTTSSSKIGKPNATTSTTTLKPTPKEITSTKSKTSEKNNHDEILLSSSDDDIPEEFDEIETVSTKSDVETLGSEDEEEIEDAPTPPPVERITRSSTKKAPSKNAPQAKVGPSTETVKVGMFRVSNARPEDVAKKVEANARKEDEGDAPELNYKDPKWRKHHNEVKEKMGHMHTSESSREPGIHAVVNLAVQSMAKSRTKYTTSFVFSISGFIPAANVLGFNM